MDRIKEEPAKPRRSIAESWSKMDHRVASDNTLAESAAGKPMRLQRNNTLSIDELGDLRMSQDMHVFSASYDIYALPKRQ